MAITSRQIGWSQESNILWSISKQLEQIARLGGGGGGSITGGGANGQIAFWDAATNITGSNNLFWNNAQGRLGIGTNAPATSIHVSLPTNTSNSAGGLYVQKGDGFFVAGNGTGAAANFVPNFLGRANFDESGLIFQGNLFNTTSTKAAIVFQAYNFASSAGIQTSQIVLGIQNATTRVANIYGTGNLVLQNGGTFSDGGQRLQVIGDTLLRGSTADNTAFALTIQNSLLSNTLRIRNDGFILFGNSSNRPLFGTVAGISSPNIDGTALQFSIDNSSGRTTTGFDILFSYGARDYTSGNVDVHRETSSFAPTSGTGTFNQFVLNGTINQQGGANGITRGIYVNATLTNAADFRAIETARGNIVFSNLPTSSAGLPAGALWNNGGVVNIV